MFDLLSSVSVVSPNHEKNPVEAVFCTCGIVSWTGAIANVRGDVSDTKHAACTMDSHEVSE